MTDSRSAIISKPSNNSALAFGTAFFVNAVFFYNNIFTFYVRVRVFGEIYERIYYGGTPL